MAEDLVVAYQDRTEGQSGRGYPEVVVARVLSLQLNAAPDRSVNIGRCCCNRLDPQSRKHVRRLRFQICAPFAGR